MIRFTRVLVLSAVILLGFVPNFAWAQSPSAWLTPASRAANFPSDTYIWGFKQGNLQNGESESALLERLKTGAKQEAVGQIRTKVESKTKLIESQVSDGVNYAIHSVYQNYSKQTSDAEVVGLKVETHYDSYERVGYAFAYVKKSELASYYKSQIKQQLQQAQKSINAASAAVSAGQKMRARKACEESLQLMGKTAYMQDLLSAIGYTDDTDLQYNEFARVKDELAAALYNLEQSIYVYLKCDEANFKTPVRILEPELKALLSKNHCSFTDDSSHADFKITIQAVTRQHEGSVIYGKENPLKYSIADVTVEVFSNEKQKVVYSGSVSQKNNNEGATYESAGRNALKVAAEAVWKKIKPWIVGE